MTSQSKDNWIPPVEDKSKNKISDDQQVTDKPTENEADGAM